MSHFASNIAYGQDDMDNDDMIEHIRTINSHQFHLNLVDPTATGTERCTAECTWGTVCNTKLPQLTTTEKSELFDIFEYNMKDIYTSTWGWNRHEKETYLLTSPRPSYFLFITNKQNKIIGFCLYRIEWDDEDEPEEPVLYCYELQINHEYQGQGLGRYLLDILYNIKQQFKLPKVMMTCFKCNEKALKFYTANKYVIDSSSPSRYGEVTDYEILSRK